MGQASTRLLFKIEASLLLMMSHLPMLCHLLFHFEGRISATGHLCGLVVCRNPMMMSIRHQSSLRRKHIKYETLHNYILYLCYYSLLTLINAGSIVCIFIAANRHALTRNGFRLNGCWNCHQTNSRLNNDWFYI